MRRRKSRTLISQNDPFVPHAHCTQRDPRRICVNGAARGHIISQESANYSDLCYDFLSHMACARLADSHLHKTKALCAHMLTHIRCGYAGSGRAGRYTQMFRRST